MINENLRNYIKENKEQGFSDDVIKKALMDVGWKEEDINEAFASFNAISVPMPSVSNNVTNKLASAPQILKEAFGIYKKRFLVFTLLTIIPLILTGVLMLVISGMGVLGIALIFAGLAVWKLIVFILVGVLLLFLFTAVHAWGQISLIYVIDNGEAKLGFWGAVKKGWHKIFSYWIVSALVGIVTMCGFALFFIPGLIFMVWFAFAVFVLIAEDIKGTKALYKSREYARDHWLGILGRLIFIFLISLIVSWIFGWIFKLINISWVETVITFILSCILLPLTLIYNFLVYKKLKGLKGDFVFVPDKKTKSVVRIVIIILITLIVAAIIIQFVVIGSSLSSAKSKARDARRIGDIRQVAFALETYYNDNNTYPVVTGCTAANWNIVIKAIQGNPPENFIDPVNSGDYKYMYASNGRDFVLKAVTEQQNQYALDDDVDGNVLGCDCDDPAYCIQP
jgi:type II secretory pathway pseudopilin PulG